MAAAPPPAQGGDLLGRHGYRSSPSPPLPLPHPVVPHVNGNNKVSKMVAGDLIPECLLHGGVGRVADLGSEGTEKQELKGLGDDDP